MKKLCLMLTAALLLLLCACTSEKQADLQPETPDISESAVSWDGLTFDRELPLSYATQFSVSYAGDDYTRITIGTDQDFLLVAENAEIPEGRAGKRHGSAPAAFSHLSRRVRRDGLL